MTAIWRYCVFWPERVVYDRWQERKSQAAGLSTDMQIAFSWLQHTARYLSSGLQRAFSFTARKQLINSTVSEQEGELTLGGGRKNPKVTRKLSVYTSRCLFYHTVQRGTHFPKLIPKPHILVCAKNTPNKGQRPTRQALERIAAAMTGSFTHLNTAETSESADASLRCQIKWRPCKYTSNSMALYWVPKFDFDMRLTHRLLVVGCSMTRKRIPYGQGSSSKFGPGPKFFWATEWHDKTSHHSDFFFPFYL